MVVRQKTKSHLILRAEIEDGTCGEGGKLPNDMELAKRFSVPGKLKVTGVSDFTIASTSQPPLTSYHVPYEEIGRQSFSLLNQMFRREAKPGTEIRVKGELVARESSVCQASISPAHPSSSSKK